MGRTETAADLRSMLRQPHTLTLEIKDASITRFSSGYSIRGDLLDYRRYVGSDRRYHGSGNAAGISDLANKKGTQPHAYRISCAGTGARRHKPDS